MSEKQKQKNEQVIIRSITDLETNETTYLITCGCVQQTKKLTVCGKDLDQVKKIFQDEYAKRNT